MAKTDKLSDYEKKRDFRKTPEPSGKGDKSGDKLVFVIQKHAASSLHYDFRIEIGGALASWAVPKGPSTDPSQKRLAVPTEDHPLSYADFEGVIPEGEYGGGAMIVWDRGSYRNLKDEPGPKGEKPMSMEEAHESGHISIWLEGKKLQGGYSLIRTRRTQGDKHQWLLVKMKDEHADARRNPVSTEPESVLSGRTVEQVKKEG